MNIGYFKLNPPPTRKSLLSPKKFQTLASGHVSVASRLSLPMVVLFFPIFFLVGIQLGQASMSKIVFSNPYQSIAVVNLPASVSFVPSVINFAMSKIEQSYNFLVDLFYRIKDNWKNFLFFNKSQKPTLDEIDLELLREQIKADILKQLNDQTIGVSARSNNSSYGVVVMPNPESNPLDNLKADLPKLFADRVKVSFSADGLSGKVTPVFRDVGEGKDYIFILNPIKK